MQRLDWLMRAGRSVAFLTAVTGLWLAGIGGAQAAPGTGFAHAFRAGLGVTDRDRHAERPGRGG